MLHLLPHRPLATGTVPGLLSGRSKEASEDTAPGASHGRLPFSHLCGFQRQPSPGKQPWVPADHVGLCPPCASSCRQAVTCAACPTCGLACCGPVSCLPSAFASCLPGLDLATRTASGLYSMQAPSHAPGMVTLRSQALGSRGGQRDHCAGAALSRITASLPTSSVKFWRQAQLPQAE